MISGLEIYNPDIMPSPLLFLSVQNNKKAAVIPEICSKTWLARLMTTNQYNGYKILINLKEYYE